MNFDSELLTVVIDFATQYQKEIIGLEHTFTSSRHSALVIKPDTTSWLGVHESESLKITDTEIVIEFDRSCIDGDYRSTLKMYEKNSFWGGKGMKINYTGESYFDGDVYRAYLVLFATILVKMDHLPGISLLQTHEYLHKMLGHTPGTGGDIPSWG